MSTTSTPRVSLIVVNYNGRRHLGPCLDSLQRSEFTDFETILVDNGSEDGSRGYVRERYPWVQVVDLGNNAGFAKANNVASARARGLFLAFLNNDVEVAPSWLGELVAAAGESNEVVAWASKLLIFDDRRLINGVGGVMNEVGYTFDRGMYERDSGQYDRPAEVLFPCAGGCLIRKDAFDAAGGFDERFFMYHEDVDLGWSLWLSGGRIKTVPTAVVYHKFGGTSKATMGMRRREYLGERNNIRCLIKHYEWPNLIRALKRLVTQRQNPARKAQLIRNLLWNLRYLPETLRLRRRIQVRRKRSDAELQYLLFPGTKVPLTLPEHDLATPESFSAAGRTVHQVTMGENEIGCLSYGWHRLETNPGGDGRPVRWTQKEACLYLSGHEVYRRLFMRVYAMCRSTGIPASGRLVINDHPCGSFACRKEGWQELQFKLMEKAPVLELRLEMDHVWVPAEVFRNDDFRKLGMAVQCVWMR